MDHVAQRSGGQLAMLRLSERLSESVTLRFVFAEEGPVAEDLRALGIPVHIESIGAVQSRRIGETRIVRDGVRFGPALFHAARAVSAIANSSGSDLIYTNSQKAHVYGGLAAKYSRLPWLAHIRDILRPPYVSGSLGLAMGAFLRVTQPTRLIANSAATAEALPHPDRVAIIPSGGTRTPQVAAREAGLPWPTLGLLGRIVPWKGQHVAVEALPAVLEQYPNAVLRIAGDAAHGDESYFESLRATARLLGVESRVQFCGFLDDPHAFFATSDIALLTSVIPEPFGQVVIEALTVGRPVIATDAGGPAEILCRRAGGLLIPPGSPSALARSVNELLASPENYRRLQEAAVLRARDFTIQTSVTKTLEMVGAALR